MIRKYLTLFYFIIIIIYFFFFDNFHIYALFNDDICFNLLIVLTRARTDWQLSLSIE